MGPRPADRRQQFGGTDRFTPWWDPRGDCPNNCSFIAGEPSGAFWTLAPAALAPVELLPLAYGAALAFGVATGALRMAAGAHFLSDVVFAGVFMYLLIWLVHGLIYRWPATRLSEAAIEAFLVRAGDGVRDGFAALAARLRQLAERAASGFEARYGSNSQASIYSAMLVGFGMSRPSAAGTSADMEADRVANFRLDDGDCLARRHAAGQIGHVGGVIAIGPFDHNRVAHWRCSLRPACFRMLFIVPGARSSDGFPATSDTADLYLMFVLPMAASGSNQGPSILLDEAYRLSNFHITAPLEASNYLSGTARQWPINAIPACAGLARPYSPRAFRPNQRFQGFSMPQDAVKDVKKVVLAYSGGLDTSIILKWLQTTYGCEVVTFTADLGQGEELEPARAKALTLGIKPENIFIEDLREEFVRDYVFPMFRANTLYEGQYLLGTSIARPLIAKKQIEIAEKVGADAVAHGATGKGNDQVRFELGYYALKPDVKVIAPWREWDFRSREALIAFAEQNQIPIAKDKRGEAPFSTDANLLHTSSEGKVLEDPAGEVPDYVYSRTDDPGEAPGPAGLYHNRFRARRSRSRSTARSCRRRRC